MKKTFHGTCPTQGKDYSISINYLDASTNDGEEYIKGTAYCEYNKYGDKCNKSQCPILKSAPQRF